MNETVYNYDAVMLHLKDVEELANATLETTNAPKNRPSTEGTEIADIIRMYSQIKTTYEAVKKLSNACLATANSWSYTMVPAAMEAAGVKTITVEGTGRVTVVNRVSASMLDKFAGMEWLRENGHEDLVTETVNASMLSAFAKSLLAEGEELPDDTFKVTMSKTTSLTKVK